ncbi:MAG: restriction endonuclease [Coriobacteriales bacterium]|nr:restriction endonuclease [Coriobacteriales bacterium]
MMDKTPNYQVFIGPVLKTAIDANTPLSRRQLCEGAATILSLTQEARKEQISSGTPRYISNAGWAATYLKEAGCLETPRRSTWQVTPRGRELYRECGDSINTETLARFPEFEEFRTRKGTRSRRNEAAELENMTLEKLSPDELLGIVIDENRRSIQNDLLLRLRKYNPYEFEHVCIDLLLAMGYGGGDEEFAELTKKSRDKGIDGIIKQDKLGLSKVYIQAKRWNNHVTEKTVRDFLGALAAEKVSNGVIITTDEFDDKAKLLAANHNIALIDGHRLVELMVKFRVGIEAKRTVEILRIDEDYFEME